MREIEAPAKVLVALLPAALLGCGSVDRGSGVPIESAPAQIAQAVCPKAYTCCSATQLMGNTMAGTDEQSCETMTTTNYQNQLNAIQASEKAGRSMYDGDKLDACLKTIRSATCETLNMTNHFTGVPGCDTFVRPLVAYGGACGFDWECVAGWCDRPPNTSGDGVCQAFAQSGAACGDHAKCGSGLICDANSSTCMNAPPVTPPTNACFYSSGCAVSSGRPGTSAVLALVFAIALTARRRRR